MLVVLELNRDSERSSAVGWDPWSGMLQQVKLPDNMDPESFLGYSRGSYEVGNCHLELRDRLGDLSGDVNDVFPQTAEETLMA